MGCPWVEGEKGKGVCARGLGIGEKEEECRLIPGRPGFV